MSSDQTVQLEFSNNAPPINMPLYSGTIGPHAFDIKRLYQDTGMLTYDPGLLSTATCRSAITYVDGEQSKLLYRGYPIEQLAQESDFLEVTYLLLNGELPNLQQKKILYTWSLTILWYTNKCNFSFVGFDVTLTLCLF